MKQGTVKWKTEKIVYLIKNGVHEKRSECTEGRANIIRIGSANERDLKRNVLHCNS